MKGWDFLANEEIFEEMREADCSNLSIVALESFASNVDDRMQNELSRTLILSHAEIAQRLEASERMLREAQQIARIGRWDIDYRADTREWSDSIYDILQIDPSLAPDNTLFLERVHPDDRAHIQENAKRLIEYHEGWTDRYRILLPDGSIRWLHVRLFTEFDAYGNPVHSYGTLQDITSLKETEDKLEQYSKHLEEMVAEQVRQTTDAQMATIYALVKLAESRDDDTGAHIERTASYCRLLAQKARELPQFEKKIDDEFVATIHRASPLHDIGKVGISDGILLKPGKLTPEEFTIMKTHVEIGYQTLKSVEYRYQNNAFIKMGLDITRYHHERWDGKGYLSGLKEEQIPLSARIMTLADVYDALRSRRVYKEPYRHDQSIAMLAEGRGMQFDPALCDLFLANHTEFQALYDLFS